MYTQALNNPAVETGIEDEEKLAAFQARIDREEKIEPTTGCQRPTAKRWSARSLNTPIPK